MSAISSVPSAVTVALTPASGEPAISASALTWAAKTAAIEASDSPVVTSYSNV